MNQRIEKYIEDTCKQLNYKLDDPETKERVMSELGFYEKVYSPDNVYSNEYNCAEATSSGSKKYFKKVFLDISDEDFRKVLELYRKERNTRRASAFKIGGIILLVLSFFILLTGTLMLGFIVSAIICLLTGMGFKDEN